MKFYKTTSPKTVADYIADRLIEVLAKHGQVLWLVPGGSAVQITALVSQNLKGRPLHNLRVTLTDERYGPVDHPDSNWFQLEQAGFDLAGAEQVPVLNGKSREETVLEFDHNLRDLLERCDYKIGFFGIGADGHTAGILPQTPEVNNSQNYACGYDSDSYERITMTFPAIEQLDEVIVYSVGESKWPELDRLETELSLADQPAQILKSASSLTIFNDYKGDEV